MKTIKNILVTVLLFVYTAGTYSQISQEPLSALSPNAANLGLYGNIPVSHYTGIPDIVIPLYEIKVKDFVLPVSLSYHASGIQVDQRAGWTGVNWSLFAGGVITRTVNSAPDDYNNPNYSTGGNAGFYFNYDLLNTASWNQRSYLRSIAQGNQSLKDTSPDEFSFSFDGYNGKFYLDHTRNWQVQCDKPVKIDFDNTWLQIPFSKTGTRAANYGYFPCFSGFTITAEDGTKYQFGKNIEAIDFSIDFFTQHLDDWVATAWYLTKITLPSRQEINFTYERNEFNNQMYIAVHHDISLSTESSGGIFNPQPACSSWNYDPIEYCYQGKLISPVYLKEITTDNVMVSFTKSLSNELKYGQAIYNGKYYDWYQHSSSAQYPFLPVIQSQQYGYPGCLDQLKWYKLDAITVTNKNQTEILKTINFNYNNSTVERLFLESMVESGKKPYVFSYYNKESLPGYLANKSDHWGYFNNTCASFLNYGNYYSYRNPNASVLKYGILTNISYPTGGYTEFEYEPHCYRKQLNIERWNPCSTLSSNQLSGGLRIRQIKNSSTPQGPAQVVKEYYYVSDYLQNGANASVSSGVLGGQVQYYFTDYTVYAFNDNNIRRRMSVFSSISVLPSCQNTGGSHIGYTEVIEKYPDNSFTRYQFTNFDNGYLDEPADAIIQQSRTPYEHYASRAKERGRLLLKEDYNANGEKVKSRNIVYEKDAVSNNYVRAMSATFKNVCPGTAVSYDEGTLYKIYTYSFRPKTEIDSIFDGSNGNIVTQMQYLYNSQKLLSETRFTERPGKTHKTMFQYPFEITDSPDSPVFQQMTEKNMLANYVRKVDYVNHRIIDGEFRKYSAIDTDNQLFMPTEIKRLRLNNPIPENQLFTVRSQGFDLSITSDAYTPENSICAGANFYTLTSARVQMEMSFSEYSKDMFSPFSIYTVHIRNIYTDKIVYQWDMRAVEAALYAPSYIFSDFLYADLAPGDYVFELKHRFDREFDPKEDISDASCNASVSVLITETSLFNSNHPAIQSEIFYRYNNFGNVIEAKQAGTNLATTYLWGYNHQYPVAEIKNADYDQVTAQIQGGQATIDAIATG
ncbi:MAG: hypothetical protein LBH32_04180, partial [Dysgonamonadaceae bacterium]|nr:hypothetical protein [Dysgonamonadaceae bacterium]